jgi:HSP20 family protein
MNVGWDPFDDISQLRQRVNRLFEEASLRPGRRLPSPRRWLPPVNIYETGETLMVEVELPGMRREAIDVQFSGDVLTIRGERNTDAQARLLHTERPHGSFQRAFTIGAAVQGDQVDAVYRDGLLLITLLKAERPVQRVEVREE